MRLTLFDKFQCRPARSLTRTPCKLFNKGHHGIHPSSAKGGACATRPELQHIALSSSNAIGRITESKQRWLTCEQTPDNKVFFFFFFFTFWKEAEPHGRCLSPCMHWVQPQKPCTRSSTRWSVIGIAPPRSVRC